MLTFVCKDNPLWINGFLKSQKCIRRFYAMTSPTLHYHLCGRAIDQCRSISDCVLLLVNCTKQHVFMEIQSILISTKHATGMFHKSIASVSELILIYFLFFMCRLDWFCCIWCVRNHLRAREWDINQYTQYRKNVAWLIHTPSFPTGYPAVLWTQGRWCLLHIPNPPRYSAGLNYLSISKFERLLPWSWELSSTFISHFIMDIITPPMVGIKLIHVNKQGPWAKSRQFAASIIKLVS